MLRRNVAKEDEDGEAAPEFELFNPDAGGPVVPLEDVRSVSVDVVYASGEVCLGWAFGSCFGSTLRILGEMVKWRTTNVGYYALLDPVRVDSFSGMR